MHDEIDATSSFYVKVRARADLLGLVARDWLAPAEPHVTSSKCLPEMILPWLESVGLHAIGHKIVDRNG